jgi:nitroreductase
VSHQKQFFFENLYDALGADIAAAGGFKAVAAKLWPSEPPSTATQKLRNTLNADQPHKLSPDEVLQIKRLAYEVGSTATVDYEAEQLGYQTVWVDPEDEAAALDREIRDLLETVNRKLDRKTKADERAALKVVR